ncbi:MAG: extracellular catalytic domain type 1 short-chain-length polyhydroxyalkanoate depolymerase [Giesbergeria sp.]
MSTIPFTFDGNPALRASMAEALALVQRGELQRASSLLMGDLPGAEKRSSSTTGSQRPAPGTARRESAARFSRSDIDDVQDLRASATRSPRSPSSTDGQGRFERTAFRHLGTEHPLHVYAPTSAAAPAGRPLVLMLHGCTQDAQDFARGTRMNAAAESAGALVLYPTQPRTANHNGCWNWFRPEDQRAGAGEPALLLAMVRQVMATEAVDPRRVYVAGLSAGGAMAALLAREYPEVFAAVGVHSGLAAGAAHNMLGALSAMKGGAKGYETRDQGGDLAVPLIVFHGDRDTTVHPRNGEQLLGTAARHGRSETESGQSGDGQRYTRTLVRSAGAGAVQAEHWLLHGAGHAWSGGDARGSHTSATGVNASQEMLRFFVEHPLAGTPPR